MPWSEAQAERAAIELSSGCDVTAARLPESLATRTEARLKSAGCRVTLVSVATEERDATRSPDAAPSDAQTTDLLSQLGQLRDAGVLTEAEFAKKKAKLLRRI